MAPASDIEAAALPAPHAFDQPRELHAADGTVLAAVGSLQEAVERLRRLGRAFLDWTGKAELLSFDDRGNELLVVKSLRDATA